MKYDISFCIPTLNRLDSLKQCIECINKSKGFTYELIIIDGGSTDGTVEYLKEEKIDFIPDIKGCVYATNLCFYKANSDLVLSLNDDMDIVPSTIKKCIELFKKDNMLGLVAPKMIEDKYNNYPNVQVDKSGFVLSKVYIVRKSILEKIGFNDEHFKKYLIDLDIHFNFLDNGYHTCVSRSVGVVHHRCEINRDSSEKKDKKLFERQATYFNKKWGKFKPCRRSLFFYLRKCMHCRTNQFLMRKQNRYFMWLYDYVLNKCSRFRYRKMDNDFYLYQKNRKVL